MFCLTLGCASASLHPTPEAGDHTAAIKVFVLAGQSNAVGYNHVREYAQGRVPLPESLRNQPKVMYWDAPQKTWKPLRVGESDGSHANAFGPEIGFAYAWAAAHPGQQVALVKYAMGGSCIGRSSDYQDYIAELKDYDDHGNHWHPPVQGRPPGKLYQTMIQHVSDATANLKQNSQAYELSGLLWMQGEGDAGISPTMATDYAGALTQFIRSVRADLHAPRLPVAIGEINSHAWRFGEIGRNAQMQVCNADPLTILVKTTDLPRGGAGGAAHFNPDGMLELGFRFAQNMEQLRRQRMGK